MLDKDFFKKIKEMNHTCIINATRLHMHSIEDVVDMEDVPSYHVNISFPIT